MGMGWAPFQINHLVGFQTDGEALKNLYNWVESPKLAIPIAKSGLNYLVAARSLRFNVYGNNFGRGKPLTLQGGPGNNYDGKLTVFPGVEEGRVDVQVCLWHETLHPWKMMQSSWRPYHYDFPLPDEVCLS